MPSAFLEYQPLYRYLKSEYACGVNSLQGPDHWSRVARNGLYLSNTTGADQDVVVLFALLHDSQRETDGADPHHGARAAEMAGECRGKYFELTDDAFELLHYACWWHTHQDYSDNITIGTCWDHTFSVLHEYSFGKADSKRWKHCGVFTFCGGQRRLLNNMLSVQHFQV